MIQPSKKMLSAIEAVLYIAYNSVSGCISSKEIAEEQHVLPRYLEQIMQKLVRHGILKGVRGPSGGYLLAREKRRITLADICKAIHEEDLEHVSSQLGEKVVIPLVRMLQETLVKHMEEITIQDLCEQAGSRNIRKVAKETNNFII